MTIKKHSLMNLRLPAGIEKLDQVLEGYQSYQALQAALKLGVFEFLDKEGPSDTAPSAILKTSECDSVCLRRPATSAATASAPATTSSSFHICFINSEKTFAPIFDKVCTCLNPGGLLGTNHWFCATGYVPENSGVQELSKALQSFGHPLCHVEDFEMNTTPFLKRIFKK
ncbi:MAG: hypothetical protein V2B19_04105 [Pseudomonadota bacterium]